MLRFVWLLFFGLVLGLHMRYEDLKRDRVGAQCINKQGTLGYTCQTLQLTQYASWACIPFCPVIAALLMPCSRIIKTWSTEAACQVIQRYVTANLWSGTGMTA